MACYSKQAIFHYGYSIIPSGSVHATMIASFSAALHVSFAVARHIVEVAFMQP